MNNNLVKELRESIEFALQHSLKELTKYNQFILYTMVPDENQKGKFKKLPTCYRTGRVSNAHDSGIWMDPVTALNELKKCDLNYGIGFVLTKDDPFWFLDIDHCVEPCPTKGTKWSNLAINLMSLFSEVAYMEVSLSMAGLHIIGMGNVPDHSCKNGKLGLELYTSSRFIALTGYKAFGTISSDSSEILKKLVKDYFLLSPINNKFNEWTSSPCEEWLGHEKDEELIEYALNFTSPRAIFGGSASFRNLWEANVDVLSKKYPDNFGNRSYDESSADAALAMHLAYLTGRDCERVSRLMWNSSLVRDKWNREDYLKRTILNACSKVANVLKLKNNTLPHVNEPDPLPVLPDILPFDSEYLPNILRGYVLDISERMQCPSDFPAISVIVMMAAVIGRKISIRPKRNDNWTIIPNLWGAVIGNSGVKKTPALKAALAPIHRLQALAFDVYEEQKKDYELESEIQKITESVKKDSVKQAIKKGESNNLKILLADTKKNMTPPASKRYITNDITYEKLGEILMENPKGVLVFYDEIIGLLKQLEKTGQEVARSFYLSGANGDTPSTFDRISRGTLHIPAVCLSIIGGIQPGILAEYVRQAVGGGIGADGLLQRFSLIVYPDISPICSYVDQHPDGVAKSALDKLVDAIDQLNPSAIGAEIDNYGGSVPFLRFDDNAQGLYMEWSVLFDNKLRSGEDHPAIVSHLAKYHKLIPALALIYHLCEEKNGPVSYESLHRAIKFSEYLESHARRVYSYATRPDIDAAKTILKRLKSEKLTNPFKSRDISQRGWAGLETSSKANSAINLLVEYGHLVPEEIATGGRRTTFYHWNNSV